MQLARCTGSALLAPPLTGLLCPQHQLGSPSVLDVAADRLTGEGGVLVRQRCMRPAQRAPLCTACVALTYDHLNQPLSVQETSARSACVRVISSRLSTLLQGHRCYP